MICAQKFMRLKRMPIDFSLTFDAATFLLIFLTTSKLLNDWFRGISCIFNRKNHFCLQAIPLDLTGNRIRNTFTAIFISGLFFSNDPWDCKLCRHLRIVVTECEMATRYLRTKIVLAHSHMAVGWDTRTRDYKLTSLHWIKSYEPDCRLVFLKILISLYSFSQNPLNYFII